MIDALTDAGELADYHLLHAARADLLRRSGRRDQAADAYRAAIDLSANAVSRAYLCRPLAEVTASV